MVAPLIAALAQPIMGIIGDLIDRAFPNSEEREKAKLDYQLKIQDQLNQINLAQIGVNQAEAQSSSLFVAGWRPFIGWVCGVAFAYHFVLQPLFAFCASNYLGHDVLLPRFDMDTLSWTLGGLLGINGSLRTIEKVKDVDTSRIKLPWRK